MMLLKIKMHVVTEEAEQIIRDSEETSYIVDKFDS